MARSTQQTNKALRDREYLLTDEVKAMATSIRKVSKYKDRDWLIIMTSYYHGFRVTELINLKWSDIDLKDGKIMVNRLKGSNSSRHPLFRDEHVVYNRIYRSLVNKSSKLPKSPYVFTSQKGSSISPQRIHEIVKLAGKLAGIDFPVHHHMLRHSCGHALAEQGQDTRLIQDWLGHVDIDHTVRYTKLSSKRFDSIKNL